MIPKRPARRVLSQAERLARKRESIKKYKDSVKGKATRKRYKQSVIGKAAKKRWRKSASGIKSKERWRKSASGKEARERALVQKIVKSILERTSYVTPERVIRILANNFSRVDISKIAIVRTLREDQLCEIVRILNDAELIFKTEVTAENFGRIHASLVRTITTTRDRWIRTIIIGIDQMLAKRVRK